MKPSPEELVQRLMAAGWSQGQIAQAIGTSQPTVCRLLNPKHQKHAYWLVDKLRDLCETHELLTDADQTDTTTD